MLGHGEGHSGTNIAVGPYEMSSILSTWQSVAYNKHIGKMFPYSHSDRREYHHDDIDGLVQERRNSIANALK